MQNDRANIKTPQWCTMTNHNLMGSDGTLAVSSQSPMLHVFYLVQHIASLSDSLDQRQSIRICVQQPDCTHNLTARQRDLHDADAARKNLLDDEKGRICRHLLRGDHADIDGNPEWHQVMLTLDGSDGDIAWVCQL